MISVKKKKGESDDRLISRFRKKIIDSGVLLELRDRERHKKDSERRKERKYRIRHQIELEKRRGF